MTNWQPASPALWQGHDGHAESPNTLRPFQTIAQNLTFSPEMYRGQIALFGFARDEGVKRSQGRTGTTGTPDVLHKTLADLAGHDGYNWLVDLRDIVTQVSGLEDTQQTLRNAIQRCQQENMRTFVLDGGHETAFVHDAGVPDTFPQARVGIASFDARLDLRKAEQATSDTPFHQLAQLCDKRQREFQYACVGISRAANAQALWDEARQFGVTMVEDLHCDTAQAQLAQLIANLDVIYLTIDLDVLPVQKMPGVSAPAALGIPLATLLRLIEPLRRSDRLLTAGMVEFNSRFDDSSRAARVAARLGWQVAH